MYWTNFLFYKADEENGGLIFQTAVFSSPDVENTVVAKMVEDGWIASPISSILMEAIKSPRLIEEVEI